MHSLSSFLVLGSILIIVGCAPAATETTPTSTAMSSLTPTEAVPSTSINDPTFEAGQWTYIFYHEGFEQIVLVNGGPEQGKPANDPLELWSWDGTQWTEIPTSNMPVRSGLNVAYDPKRDRFILFGGVDRPGGTALDETWEWDRDNWVCVHNCG